MIKFLAYTRRYLAVLFFVLPVNVWAATKIPAKDITVNASAFSKNLGPTDTDAQHTFNTIDQMAGGTGGGNVSQSGAVATNYFPKWTGTGAIGNSTYSTTDAANWTSATHDKIQFIIDGHGATIAAGASGSKAVAANCTITSWDMTSNATGNITVDVKKTDYATFPTFSSIAAAAKPAIANTNKNTNSTLTGWTKTFAVGDRVQALVDSADINGAVVLTLYVTKNQ